MNKLSQWSMCKSINDSTEYFIVVVTACLFKDRLQIFLLLLSEFKRISVLYELLTKFGDDPHRQ